MKKLSKHFKDEIKQMALNNQFFWYECSGNHRFRSWFMQGEIKAYCTEGHLMRREYRTAPHSVSNSVIEWFESESDE